MDFSGKQNTGIMFNVFKKWFYSIALQKT